MDGLIINEQKWINKTGIWLYISTLIKYERFFFNVQGIEFQFLYKCNVIKYMSLKKDSILDPVVTQNYLWGSSNVQDN